MIHQKHKKSLEEITNDLCPVLSVQQLYRISTMYWDDRYNTETVAHEARSPPPSPLPPLPPSLCSPFPAASTASPPLPAPASFGKADSAGGFPSSELHLVWSEQHWDGVHGGALTAGFPAVQVLARMKQLMVDNNTAASHSFLLDDDSSIPFSLDDIAALMEDKARTPALFVAPPPPLRAAPSPVAAPAARRTVAARARRPMWSCVLWRSVVVVHCDCRALPAVSLLST